MTSYPEGHWSLEVDIPYSMGVRQGDLLLTCGQADLRGMGEVCNPGNLYAQTAAAINHIRTIFSDLGSNLEQLAKLTVCYVNNGDVDQAAYGCEIARLLNTKNAPVVAMVPLTHFFYPGVMVEIDAVGELSNTPREYLNAGMFGPVTEGLSQALRSGEFVFTGGITAARADGSVASPDDSVAQSHQLLARLENILQHFGADRRDLVKLNNWFVM